jgi:hypothetical protein
LAFAPLSHRLYATSTIFHARTGVRQYAARARLMHGVGDDDFLKMINVAYICLFLKQGRLRMRFHFSAWRFALRFVIRWGECMHILLNVGDDELEMQQEAGDVLFAKHYVF